LDSPVVDSQPYVEAVLIYYSDNTLEVTSRALNLYGHVFALRDLGDVWHCEAVRQPGRSRDSAHEIWAIWRGQTLMLLRIADDTRFGQVYRAIERALEQNPR
jgi:hypothetical protein